MSKFLRDFQYMVFIGHKGSGKSFLCDYLSMSNHFSKDISSEFIQEFETIHHNIKIVDTPNTLINDLNQLYEYTNNKAKIALIYVANNKIEEADREVIKKLLESPLKDNLLVLNNKNNVDILQEEIFPVINFPVLNEHDKIGNKYLDDVKFWIDDIQKKIQERKPHSVENIDINADTNNITVEQDVELNIPQKVSEDILPNNDNIKYFHIILIGPTGVGKSFLCNHFSGTNAFVEGSGTSSQTNEILSVISSKNESHVIVDTPGLLDSNGNDQIYLKKLIEYMKGKAILGVIYVTSGTINDHDRSIINELLRSDVKDNLLVIFNKYAGDNFINNEKFNVLPFISFSPTEKKSSDYSDYVNEQLLPILTWINSKPPVTTHHFKQPVGLFKQPIQITHEDKEVKENIKLFEKQVMEKVTKYRKVRVSVKVGEKWQGWAGFGNKKDVFEDRDIDEPYETEEFVTKKYLKYDKYHVKYALRFDDMTAVYAKEYLGSFEEPQQM